MTTDSIATTVETSLGILQGIQRPNTHQVEFRGGVLARECSSIISDFFKLRRLEKKRVSESLP